MIKLRMGLLPRIIIAIVLGIALGHVTGLPIVRLFATFNSIFSNLLGFLIPLIIVGLVTPAIGDVGRGAGRMLLVTAFIAYFDTVASGCFSYLVSSALFPSFIAGCPSSEQLGTAEEIIPYFTIQIPAMLDVMSALIFSFIVGLGIAGFGSGHLKSLFSEFRSIVTATIEHVVIPLLPLYIFGIFLIMTFTGQAARVITVFVSIILVIFAMHVLLLLFQYAIAGFVVGRNPLRLLYNMLPAYFTALGTSSSAATIPVTLKQTLLNGVREGIAGFVIPLCATIHLSGSALKITACAVALMLMQGIPFDFPLMLGFVLMLGVMMVAAPGVPGGAIMAALGVLSGVLGFNDEQQALMIALYIAMDSFGTACNVTGDGAIALVMDRIWGMKGEGRRKSNEMIKGS